MTPPAGRKAFKAERRIGISNAADETEDVDDDVVRLALVGNCAACDRRVIKDGRIASNADSVELVKCKFELRRDDLRMLTKPSGSGTCLELRN